MYTTLKLRYHYLFLPEVYGVSFRSVQTEEK